VLKRLQNEIEVFIFINKYKIHQQLKHKNIVKLINIFEDADNHYLMLEFCEGGDLFHYLKSKGILCEMEMK